MELVPVQAEVTAYVPRSEICGTTDRTADGTDTDDVAYGLAASHQIPLGTIIYIPTGHGCLDRIKAFDRAFQVDDRFGPKRVETGTLRLDLRVKDLEWAKKFGRKTITVYIERKYHE